MLIPTLHFPGTCDEAIAYYKEIAGAEVKTIMHFRDAPPDTGIDLPPNFVMYSEVLLFGTLLSMTDGAEKQVNCDIFTLTLALDSIDDVTALFHKLAEDGQAVEYLAPQFWTSLSGYVTDRFGVNWNIFTRDALE